MKVENIKLKIIIVMQQEKILLADDKKFKDHLFETKFREKLSGKFFSTQIYQILNKYLLFAYFNPVLLYFF